MRWTGVWGAVSTHRAEFFQEVLQVLLPFSLERDNGKVTRQGTQIPSKQMPLQSIIVATKAFNPLSLSSMDFAEG